MTSTPSIWDLTDHGLHVRYEPAGVRGEPQLLYHDIHRTRAYSGKEIRVESARDIGTLVSVTLEEVVDLGWTSFTLMLPECRVKLGEVLPVRALAITTLHHTPIVGPRHGQLETYSVMPLTGTATFVQNVTPAASGGG